MQTIIIPVETKRNCIEKAGKLFCEERVTTGKDIAWSCVAVLAILVWGFTILGLLSSDMEGWAFLVFIVPFLVLIVLGFSGYLG